MNSLWGVGETLFFIVVFSADESFLEQRRYAFIRDRKVHGNVLKTMTGRVWRDSSEP